LLPVFRPRPHRIEDASSGLLAFIVIDDTTLGPAAGGIRTRSYDDEDEALAEAAALARTMTYKCALAGLPAGGGKGVVMLRDDLDRERAFEILGEFIESLGGELLTAGDLGTTPADLAALARRTRHVETDESGLAEAVGRGCVRAMLARVVADGGPAADGLAGKQVAVQGCGTVGAAVARAAARDGARVTVADLDPTAAAALAAQIGADVVSSEVILEQEADILAPCAVGGVISAAAAQRLRAGAVCGAANNILASPDVEEILRDRGIGWVPDVLSSAGAVILGVGRRVIGLHDCGALIDRVFDTTLEVISRARDEGRRAGDIARSLAEQQIRAARRG
jgi:glutamate dehydrogenase/leucine dehydrogenase